MKITRNLLLGLCLMIPGLNSLAQTTAVPSLIHKNGRHALLVDGKPFLMLGGQAHNSSAWPGMMPQVWQAAKLLHLNTLEVPLYWEQIEPAPGKFDFSVVDTLLKQARIHKVRLVFLWFGTWKNGSNHYMPEWMKQDAAKYPNVVGKKNNPIDSPSPHAAATLDADVKAFSAVMRYLKKADAARTVIMVQVENEPGTWDSVRDYSPVAQQLFEQQVPAALLKPEVLKQLNTDLNAKGTWKQVFGDRADEYFHAWSVASFIGKVAAAGKAEYPLPFYVNAALRDPLTNPMANTYESGGPTDNVIAIWKAAAPAMDLLAPDIYLSGSERVLKVMELYNRPDNALFVPEAGLLPENAKYLYDVIAKGGIGFSPFGIDANGQAAATAKVAERLSVYGREYEVAATMMRELAQWAFEGKIKAVVEHDDHAEQSIDLGDWTAVVTFGQQSVGRFQPNEKPFGALMVVQLAKDKFLLNGALTHVTFKPAGSNTAKAWQYLKVEEGTYQNGVFKPLRILNGDETDSGGPNFGTEPKVLMVTLVKR
ncbi:hypothetical protein DYU05_14090 [Mucilaginibacter terrenus]|uniref:Beta-galactosidase n=1 Tax=Mucilaginibacter terrenus TaxID=2482727 RepID=A0A3E2NQJ1_9SPHI|nr:DUF5597 domain-containing protein [Mucilaginibacter terrenus]RFZ83264.1 hypothetical protein DYU05_14090 [Mucilaginibacter terrenus]